MTAAGRGAVIPAEAPETVSIVPSSPRQILAVDHDSSFLQRLYVLLRTEGQELILANSGDAAELARGIAEQFRQSEPARTVAFRSDEVLSLRGLG